MKHKTKVLEEEKWKMKHDLLERFRKKISVKH